MKIKLNQILESKEKTKKLSEIKLPIKISYKINKLISKLDAEFKLFETEKNSLIKEYGDLDEETKNIIVKDPTKMETFYKKLSELVDIEVDIDFEKIKIEDIGDITIEPAILVDWIFE